MREGQQSGPTRTADVDVEARDDADSDSISCCPPEVTGVQDIRGKAKSRGLSGLALEKSVVEDTRGAKPRCDMD